MREIPWSIAVLLAPFALQAQVPDSVIVITGGGTRGPPVGPHPHAWLGEPAPAEYPEVLAELRQENGPRTRAELDSIAEMLVEWATSEEVIHR